MTIRPFVWLTVALLAAGCGAGSGKKAGSDKETAALRDFPYVQVPVVYSNNAKGREAYVAEHFWDRFFSGAEGTYCDSVTVCGVPGAKFEEAFATYITLLQNMEIYQGKEHVYALFDKIEACQKADTLSNVFEYFNRMMEHYLFDPNSPMRDEDLYQPYVVRLASSSLTDPDLVPAYAADAVLCGLNAINTPAADFVYRDAAGRSHRLYDTEARNTLIFFSNPGCKACRDITARLKAIPGLSEKVASGRLAILSIYIDEDIAEWRKSISEYPSDWIVGYDPTQAIRGNLLYHIRAIPSLYLLDWEKKVLMKDAPEERLYKVLESL